MEKKIDEVIYRYGMENAFEGAVIGFSGGADSSALLHYLKDRCKCLLAVHINHMIRGDEAKRDEELCRRTCEKYGVEFKCVEVDVPTLSKERKKGIEETARDERYRIFKEILNENPQYKCIVTAHNSNDNAETIIFNLVRGSGINGLSGIKPAIDRVYRPLINCTRDEIIEYCSVNNIEYVTDSTNNDTDYTRNHIRHKVIPQLLEVNAGFLDSCARLSEILRQDEEYILKEAYKITSLINNGNIPKDVACSLDEAILVRVLKTVSGENLDYKSVKSCIQLIKKWSTGKMVNLEKGITFKIEHSYCSFIKTDETKSRTFNVKLEKGINYIDELNIAIGVNEELLNSDFCEIGSVRLNSSQIQGTLYARSKEQGDSVKSKGITKKLKKVFTDLHIPSHLRPLLPVICDDLGVLAVPGIVARDKAFDKKGDINIRVYNYGGSNEKEK